MEGPTPSPTKGPSCEPQSPCAAASLLCSWERNIVTAIDGHHGTHVSGWLCADGPPSCVLTHLVPMPEDGMRSQSLPREELELGSQGLGTLAQILTFITSLLYKEQLLYISKPWFLCLKVESNAHFSHLANAD